MSAFNEGLMTGASLGRGAYQARQRQELATAYQGGGMTGAATAAFGQGDFETGSALQTAGRAEDARTRGGQIVGALKTGDYDGAMSFASSPEELAQITSFRDSASEAERAQAAQQAGSLAAVIESIQGLPLEQQFAQAQALAPQFGIDPSRITPETLTPQALNAIRIQAIGLKDFLMYQDRTLDNERQASVAEAQIASAQALADQRRVSAGVAQSREARQGAGRSSGGGSRSSGGTRPSGSGGSAPVARGGTLPPGFTIRRR
jgi:hypothetical protein